MMETSELKKQRWVDYSDDGTSSLHSSESSILQNPEIQKLAHINPTHEYVWLKMRCPGASKQAKKKIKDLRYENKGNAVYESEEYEGFEVKLPKARAKQILELSIPGIKSLKITLSERNFANEKHNTKKGVRKCESQRKNFNRNTGSRDAKNVRYVDKATGKAPNNRQKIEKRLLQEDQRKYSRKQAEQLGFSLANFRSKQPKKIQPNLQSRQQYMAMETNKQYQMKMEKQKPKKNLKRVRSQQNYRCDVNSPSSSKKVNPWRRKEGDKISKSKKNEDVVVRNEKGDIKSHKSPKHYEAKKQNRENHHEKPSKTTK